MDFLLYFQILRKGSRIFFQARKLIFCQMACIYLLNSCGGPQSFDFDITYFSNYSYPLLVNEIVRGSFRNHQAIHMKSHTMEITRKWRVILRRNLMTVLCVINVSSPGTIYRDTFLCSVWQGFHVKELHKESYKDANCGESMTLWSVQITWTVMLWPIHIPYSNDFFLSADDFTRGEHYT